MERILIIQTAFIGDALLTLPMIEKLKEKIPDSAIDVLAIPKTKEVFALSPFVDDIIVIDKHGEHKSLFSLLKFAKNLKKKNYTKIFSPHRSLRSAIIVMQLGVRETYGFSNSSLMHVYKHMIDYSYDHHEVQRNLDLIDYKYGESGWKFTPACRITLQEKNKIDKLISDTGSPAKFITIAPGSIWNTKIYPKNYLLEVINYLKDSMVDINRIYLIGSAADKNLCDNIASNFENKINSVAGELTIAETVELLKRSELLITNDSAPTHMGMCAGIPVLTIYCSTTVQFGFYPYNLKSSFISYDELKCKPCGIHGFESCPLKHFDCGNKLLPEMVVNKIKEMMDSSKA